MSSVNTDAILWYDVGRFGELGYAVPNWSDDVGSLNPQILDIVELIGRNTFAIMHHEDVDLRIPPSINTLYRVHNLYVRSTQVLGGRSVPPNVLNFEMKHNSPAGEIFKVYPTPYFKVRNVFLKRWCGLMLAAMAEAMQHTENRKETEISTQFGGLIGSYITRVYQNMSIELFGKTREVATAPGFLLTDTDLGAYDPTSFFTSTELVDTVPSLGRVLTEDRLSLLNEGIPVTELAAVVKPWPVNLTSVYEMMRTDGQIGDTATLGTGSTVAAGNMPPPPGP